MLEPALSSADPCHPEPPPVQTELVSTPKPPPLNDYLLRQLSRELAELPVEDQPQRRREAAFMLFSAIPGTMLSALVHLLLLIAMGLYMMVSVNRGGDEISVEVVQLEELLVEEDPLDEMAVDLEPLPDSIAEELIPDPLPLEPDLQPDSEAVETLDGDIMKSTAFAQAAAVAADASGTGGGVAGLSARGNRRDRALSLGATSDSENAVDRALEWIVRHQRKDGSWSFDLSGEHQCVGCNCQNRGSYGQATLGATGMSLLPLLGAGNTHRHGRFQQSVAKGLRYLVRKQKSDGSLRDPQGNMYSHGLATLALCEALAMTRYNGDSADNRVVFRPDQLMDVSSVQTADLEYAAQLAVSYIERAQHNGGGWRYSPRQAGDTSVVGWQMMALRSGQIAGLRVKPATFRKAETFLNSASIDKIGSCYAYTPRGRPVMVAPNSPIGATTPIGLLCRMYTGWGRDKPGIRIGAERISRWARPDQGMYFYYYATQVMHHYRGEPWHRWNAWMRDYLVKSQSRGGSQKGSWALKGNHDSAGRLYCTAMAAMTLEIYYRYSPIYGADALRQDTKLDRSLDAATRKR